MSTHYVIGCGGIGCWLVPLLKKMTKGDRIAVMDGDRIEERNFDRQFHAPEYLGWNKAEALYATYGLDDYVPAYLSRLNRPKAQIMDWIWCCVDNHAARIECLSWIDDLPGLNGVFGANEYDASQAFVYFFDWKDQPYDPRVRFPEMVTDRSNDPVHPNCQGPAQEAAPQLAVYNYLAAGQMMHLYWFWKNHPYIQKEIRPVEHWVNLAIMQTNNQRKLDEFIRSVSDFRETAQNS